MPNRKPVILIVGSLLVIGLTIAGWWYVTSNPQTAERLSTAVAPAQSTGPFAVSGFIEAEEIAVSTEIGGRITALPASGGSSGTTAADRTLTSPRGTVIIPAKSRSARQRRGQRPNRCRGTAEGIPVGATSPRRDASGRPGTE